MIATRDDRPPVWAIWAIVSGLAALQLVTWTGAGGLPRRPFTIVQFAASWVVMLLLAALCTRAIRRLSRNLARQETAHLATLSEVGQLQTQNEMLQIVAQTVDVPLAFQSLASRIARLVPCDRVGLALLSENGQEFQTYTARVHEEERRLRARPEIVFKIDRTAIGNVVRAREPLVIADTSESAPDYLDVNVLHSAGFGSALIVPLVSKGRAVGTLNVVSRSANAFDQAHIAALQPIAEIFAVAHLAQQLQIGLAKYRAMEAMSEQTLMVAAEINSALQTIIGHCDLLERGYPDPHLQRDLATIARQAQRISALLERMRAAAHERMKEAAASVQQDAIPSSPEAYGPEAI
jgi:signal transduction protein with GAF and PtsI domain